MPEWLIGAVSKTVVRLWCTVGSNPTPSAKSQMTQLSAQEHTLDVLRSEKDGRLYTGVTGDLRQRLKDHAAGKVASTRHRRPLRLVYTESFESRTEAWARERYFKTPQGGGLKQRLTAEHHGGSLLQ